MLYNPDLQIPWGYGTSYKRLGDVAAILAVHYHPEYVRRLLRWLTHKNGTIGIGGHWRAFGSQPDKPGFAPEGKSFHQSQLFVTGQRYAVAVDLVAPDGPDGNHDHDGVSWEDVPRQGSQEAAIWGVHCNIDTEAWHMQPIEIDGWQTWVNLGRPDIQWLYPIPPYPTTPAPLPTEEDDVDAILMKHPTTGQFYVTDRRSYANKVTTEQAVFGRDHLGWKVAADTGPFPADVIEAGYLESISK